MRTDNPFKTRNGRANRSPTLGQLMLILVGCALLVATCSRAPEICDDVTREAGGCDPNQPTFEAMDCETLAESTVRQLTERFMDIHEGPDGGEDSKQPKRGIR